MPPPSLFAMEQPAWVTPTSSHPYSFLEASLLDPFFEHSIQLQSQNMLLAQENALLRLRCAEAVHVAASTVAALSRSTTAPPGLVVMERPQVCTDVAIPDVELEVVAVDASEEEACLPWEMPPPEEPGTSLMLRNIPNNYTRTMLVDLIDVRGFAGTYDFIHLPVDFKSQANLGYAFLNFIDCEYVETFWRAFEGFTAWSTSRSSNSKARVSSKVGYIEWNKFQGLAALIDRFRNNPVMHESVPEEHKPLLVLDGVESPFPEPTLVLKAPRMRKPAQRVARKRLTE